MRTIGVEEELLVVDPGTWAVAPRAREVLAAHAEDEGTDGLALDPELFRHQLEIRTDPTRDVEELARQVAAARGNAAEAVAARDLAVAACGTAPLGAEDPQVSPDDRYRDMIETYGDVARLGSTCGMHVHVAVESDEEGVGCLDRIAPWLPVLLAMSTNSPFSAGRDTGYASWRTQRWSTWPSAGPSEAFGDVADYRRACARMIESGAARDRGMLYWDARLSDDHPTLEVRILDVVTDPEDTALLAALVRALVETMADQWRADVPSPAWRCEELRAARWRAARYGLAGQLLDPSDHELRPAADVVGALRSHIADRLDSAGDSDRVDTGIARVLAGTGAVRQRAAFERTGSVEGVVADLVARTTGRG